MVEPKAKRKCKIKKKKEKAVTFEKLAIISKVMVHGDLLEDEAQSLKKLEEELTMTPSHKRKKKKGKDGARLSKDLAQEKNSSLIA